MPHRDDDDRKGGYAGGKNGSAGPGGVRTVFLGMSPSFRAAKHGEVAEEEEKHRGLPCVSGQRSGGPRGGTCQCTGFVRRCGRRGGWGPLAQWAMADVINPGFLTRWMSVERRRADLLRRRGGNRGALVSGVPLGESTAANHYVILARVGCARRYALVSAGTDFPPSKREGTPGREGGRVRRRRAGRDRVVDAIHLCERERRETVWVDGQRRSSRATAAYVRNVAHICLSPCPGPVPVTVRRWGGGANLPRALRWRMPCWGPPPEIALSGGRPEGTRGPWPTERPVGAAAFA